MYVFNARDPDLLENLEEIQYAEKELLWYLIQNGDRLPISSALRNVPAFEFDPADIPSYITDLVEPQNSNIDLLNAAQGLDLPEDENLEEELEKARHKRQETINLNGSPNFHPDEVDDSETE